MRRYRTRDTVRSALWDAGQFDQDTVRAEAERRLESGDYS